MTALRSLLRFLHVEGMVKRSLVAAVPAIARWHLAGLPKSLEPAKTYWYLSATPELLALAGSRLERHLGDIS